MRDEAPAQPTESASKSSRRSRSKDDRKRGKKDDAASAATSGTDGGDRKIDLDEDFLVEGKLEKPNAFFILKRSQSGYDWARLDAKFLPLVLESVQDPLF